jgi:hypothetical protein
MLIIYNDKKIFEKKNEYGSKYFTIKLIKYFNK